MAASPRPLAFVLTLAAASFAPSLRAQTHAADARSSMAGMPGMGPQAGQPMAPSASRDSTRAFLRMMVDHHQGLIAMGDSARVRATRAGTTTDARTLLDEQATEQRRMETMLRRTFGVDSVQPTVIASNRAIKRCSTRSAARRAPSTTARSTAS